LTDHLTYGKNILDQYYESYQPTWSDQVKYEIEHKVRDVHIGGVPVTGLLDRIDKRDDGIHVFDYKSGKTTRFGEKLRRPNDADPVGGDYWRQMVFYDLLLKQDPKFRTHMTRGYIQALEPEKDGRFIEREIVVTDEDRAIVTQQIVDTYQHIQDMEFEKGCGECPWCRMHELTPPIFTGDEENRDG
jgi:DNA helicase-2/ATP-dependent DNA helicase PcrA